jgi:hypothetical protein
MNSVSCQVSNFGNTVSYDEESSSLDNNQISTIRRLPDSDVRAVFECLHENKPAPSHLKFVIVPVGSSGLKLSPPSYEFSGKHFLMSTSRYHIRRILLTFHAFFIKMDFMFYFDPKRSVRIKRILKQQQFPRKLRHIYNI